MKKLFTSVIILLFIFTLFIPALPILFNLDFLPGYSFFLAIIAIFIMLVTVIWKPKPSLIYGVALISYILYTLIAEGNSQPKDYLIELVLFLIVIGVTSSLSNTFFQQIQIEGETTSTTNQTNIHHYQQIRAIIESEFARGFRYGFPIVMIRIQGVSRKTDEKQNKTLIQELDKKTVNLLTTNLRVTDILVRMNGINNFLLICPGIETEEAELMIHRLTRLAYNHDSIELNHQIVAFPKDGHSFEELFERLNRQSYGKS